MCSLDISDGVTDAAIAQYQSENLIKKAFTTYIFGSGHANELAAALQKILISIPKEQRASKEQYYHSLIFGMIQFMGSSFSYGGSLYRNWSR